MFTGLDSDWQDWVRRCMMENVSPDTIAQTLYERGFATAAIELLKHTKQAIKTPYIDIKSNMVKLSDRTVPILFTSNKPVIVVLDSFLSPNECQKMIQLASSKLEVSKVIHHETGELVEHKNRTSTSTHFKRAATPLLAKLEDRIAELTHWPVENGENFQLLRYEHGAQFRPHHDFFDPAAPGSQRHFDEAGQRVGTFIMYLSDVETGGATIFPQLNFEVRPKKGMAVYFSNILLDGNVDQSTLHGGLPVTTGVKYLATKWLRERFYQCPI